MRGIIPGDISAIFSYPDSTRGWINVTGDILSLHLNRNKNGCGEKDQNAEENIIPSSQAPQEKGSPSFDYPIPMDMSPATLSDRRVTGISGF